MTCTDGVGSDRDIKGAGGIGRRRGLLRELKLPGQMVEWLSVLNQTY